MTYPTRFTHGTGATRLRNTLTLAVLTALCMGPAFAADRLAVQAGALVTVARSTRLFHGDAVMGALPMTQPIHVVVALKPRDKEGLDALVARNSADQVQGIAPQLMTPARFLSEHAPTPEQVQAVANYLSTKGFRNIVIAPNRMLVSADGTARTARDAFATTFAQIRTHDGRIAFANTDEVRIPAALSDKILSVVGLQTVHIAHTFIRMSAFPKARTFAVFGHDPNEFNGIYDGTPGVEATNVSVGIITQGSLAQMHSDLDEFTEFDGLDDVTTTTVYTHGRSGQTTNTAEWDLDSEDILGMAGGGVRQLVFYNIPTLGDDDLTADINTIVADDKVKIINASLGECETTALDDGSAAAQDVALETAVAQGQTFAVAAGDSGAEECDTVGGTTPSWPASSQYVIAVAGTTLSANPNTDVYTGETVWNELAVKNGATGGSQSLFETEPSWQKKLWAGPLRGVPDVAFDADQNSGSIFVYFGDLALGGGTSLSAPLFSGAWALVLQQYPNIGFAGPVIYGLPTQAFRDVSVGDNDGETAAKGYDLASGRGSLKIAIVIADAIKLGHKPPITNFSYVVNGMTATFTDSSTDGGGKIVTYAWKFGDGATSSATNPVHTYAVGGTYKVTEVVKDQGGAVTAKTETLVIGGTQLLLNPGFETGTPQPWTIEPASVLTDDPSLALAGSWFAALGSGTGTHTDRASQAVTIPGGKTAATLAFYLSTTTTETTTTAIHDHLDVQVYAADGTTLLATLASYSNLDTTSGYVAKSLDMTPYIGQTVRLKFIGVNNSTLPTSWDLDDVALTVK